MEVSEERQKPGSIESVGTVMPSEVDETPAKTFSHIEDSSLLKSPASHWQSNMEVEPVDCEKQSKRGRVIAFMAELVR